MASEYFQRTFGLDEGVFRRVIGTALSRGGTFCDLFFQHRVANSIALEDNRVNRASSSVSLGVGIRVVDGETTGYAFCEDLEEASMHRAAEAASAICDGNRKVPPPAALTSLTCADRYPVSRRWDEVETGQRLPVLERLNDAIFARDKRVTRVRLNLSDIETRVLVVTSDGTLAADDQPMSILQASCVAEQDGRREQNSHSLAGRYDLTRYDEATLDRVADQVVERTTRLFEAVRPGAGEMPVVLGPGASGILLHEAIGHGMEADFNRKGTSIYADKLGKPIARPFVSIVDDGTLDGMRGAINVDDEGVPGQRTVLVEGGVLRTFLHDRISARHYGVEPTGNGRRQSFHHIPLPRMRCTYMLPGPHDPEEIIRSVDRGIYAESFANGQVQIGAGDFTFYIKTGYLIEEGKLTAPIKDVNIIGNGPKVLEDVVMVGTDLEHDGGGWTCGKDGQSVPVSIGLPTVKVGAITVGGVG